MYLKQEINLIAGVIWTKKPVEGMEHQIFVLWKVYEVGGCAPSPRQVDPLLTQNEFSLEKCNGNHDPT